jgi:hypothetical protein
LSPSNHPLEHAAIFVGLPRGNFNDKMFAGKAT